MNIITRGDFDGLVCSVLLTEVETVNTIRFAHPREMQQRKVSVTNQDIIVNLPYHPDCGMWFDHHISEQVRGSKPESFKGAYGLAPSCARLVYEYYKKPEWERFHGLLAETDKIDSAQLNLNDILRPEGWVRVSNTVDPRSGFAASREYFLNLVDWIKEHTIEEILNLDDVRDRVREYFKQQEEYKKALADKSTLEGGVVITDFRGVRAVPVGSRFLVYAIFPRARVAVRVFDGPTADMVTIAVGHSIINRGCKVDVGNLMAEYGGGGHVGAGTCAVTKENSDQAITDIVTRLNVE